MTPGRAVRAARRLTLDDWRDSIPAGAEGVVVELLSEAYPRFDMVIDFGPDHPRVSVYADEVEPFNG